MPLSLTCCYPEWQVVCLPQGQMSHSPWRTGHKRSCKYRHSAFGLAHCFWKHRKHHLKLFYIVKEKGKLFRKLCYLQFLSRHVLKYFAIINIFFCMNNFKTNLKRGWTHVYSFSLIKKIISLMSRPPPLLVLSWQTQIRSLLCTKSSNQQVYQNGSCSIFYLVVQTLTPCNDISPLCWRFRVSLSAISFRICDVTNHN